MFDEDDSGTIDRDELRKLLEQIEPRVTEDDIKEAMDAMYKEGDPDQITFDEFAEWYFHSLIYEHEKKLAEEELAEVWYENLIPREEMDVWHGSSTSSFFPSLRR